MGRYIGWAEVRGGPEQHGWVDAARALVEAHCCAGGQVGLSECDGRWHLWVDGTTSGPCPGPLVSFFKALGSIASDSFGVLETGSDDDPLSADRHQRWVMFRGSVAATTAWDQISA